MTKVYKVPELNLPKFKPMPKSKQEHIDSIYWRYKKKSNPKPTSPKHGKVRISRKHKLKDKYLINEDISHTRHLQAIMGEEF